MESSNEKKHQHKISSNGTVSRFENSSLPYQTLRMDNNDQSGIDHSISILSNSTIRGWLADNF
jgi:hypothetical protein